MTWSQKNDDEIKAEAELAAMMDSLGEGLKQFWMLCKAIRMAEKHIGQLHEAYIRERSLRLYFERVFHESHKRTMEDTAHTLKAVLAGVEIGRKDAP